mgnify:CR=1 FL=1
MKHLMYLGLGFCVLMLGSAWLAFAIWAYNFIPENYQFCVWLVAWMLFMSYLFGYLTYETYIRHRLEKKDA